MGVFPPIPFPVLILPPPLPHTPFIHTPNPPAPAPGSSTFPFLAPRARSRRSRAPFWFGSGEIKGVSGDGKVFFLVRKGCCSPLPCQIRPIPCGKGELIVEREKTSDIPRRSTCPYAAAGWPLDCFGVPDGSWVLPRTRLGRRKRPCRNRGR